MKIEFLTKIDLGARKTEQRRNEYTEGNSDIEPHVLGAMQEKLHYFPILSSFKF